MAVLGLTGLPWCRVVVTGPWDAPPGRWFISYRARHGFRWLLGQGVVDEFATFSSPIFLAPRSLLGEVYDAGLTLGHRRDAEMAIDSGWPPLCIGLDRPAPSLPADWQSQLLQSIFSPPPDLAAEDVSIDRRTVEAAELLRLRFAGGAPRDEVTLIATDAPLLPHQLGRLCDLDDRGLTVALATGNRITRQPDSGAQAIDVLAESRLARLASALEAMP